MEQAFDNTTLQALQAVADLLEAAYRRWLAVRRVPAQLFGVAVNKELEIHSGTERS